MGDFCEITVVALMERKEAQKVSSGAVVGDRSLFEPGDCGCVVAKRG